ncbi:unnamed protein product [Ixodes hexagonus]
MYSNRAVVYRPAVFVYHILYANIVTNLPQSFYWAGPAPQELCRWRAVDGLLAAGREERVWDVTQKQMCSFISRVPCFQSLVVLAYLAF